MAEAEDKYEPVPYKVGQDVSIGGKPAKIIEISPMDPPPPPPLYKILFRFNDGSVDYTTYNPKPYPTPKYPVGTRVHTPSGQGTIRSRRLDKPSDYEIHNYRRKNPPAWTYTIDYDSGGTRDYTEAEINIAGGGGRKRTKRARRNRRSTRKN